MQFVRLMIASLTMLAATTPTFAQSVTGELRPGAAIRMRSDPSGPKRVKGTLVSATRDSLVLIAKGRTILVPRRDVQQLDVQRRRTRGAGALRMATWFGVIGAGILGPASLSHSDYSCGNDTCRTEGGDAASIFVVGLASSLLGQVYGAMKPGNEWVHMTPGITTTGNNSPPPRGSHVRITAPGYTAPDLVGDVATATSDSLSLLARSSVINVPMSSVTRLEYANGSDRARGAVRGLLQAVPLAAFYLGLGWLDQTTDVYRNGVIEEGHDIMQEALVVSSSSLAVGAGLGAIFAPPAWAERRTSTGLLIAPDVQHRAMRVGLGMKF